MASHEDGGGGEDHLQGGRGEDSCVLPASCKSSFQQAAARLRSEKKGRLKVMDITELVGEALA